VIFQTWYFAKRGKTRKIMALSMALTDKQVSKAKPGEKPYKLTDGRGLMLLVQPSGSKLWQYKYSFGGKQKLMALGVYPVITLAMARERHIDARRLLASGTDPMAQRKEEKIEKKTSAGNSFQSIADLWLAQWSGDKTPRHIADTERRLASNILPYLGSRPVAEIEAPELVAMVKAIEERGARDIARRALEKTGQIFRYAVTHGYTKRNPAAEIKPRDVLTPTKRVNFACVDGRDVAELLRSIEVYRGTHVTRLAMKLLALTFVRTRELIEAPWSEFDLDRARWDIPKERMKMRTPHIVPLSRQAVEILRSLHRLSGHCEFVFPGRDPKKPMSNMTILKGLERMGYKGKHTGHGFRRLGSTLLHEQGYNHDHIELQLAHTPRNAVSAAYNHALYLEPRRKMLQWYADHLDMVQHGGKVIPFVA
jgi:integrase